MRQHKSAYVPDCRLRRYVQIAEFLVLTATWAGLLSRALEVVVRALTLAMWAGLLKCDAADILQLDVVDVEF